MTQVKAIVFDAGNVLAHYSFDSVVAFLEARGAPVTDFHSLCEALPVRKYERGEITTMQFISAVQDICPEELDLDEMLRCWTEIFTPDYELLAIAEDLRKLYSIGVLSNTSELHWNHLLDTCGFSSFADHLMPSHKLGVRKPDPEIYKLAEERLGCRGTEIVFFDDLLPNVTAALNHGWQAVLYRSPTDVRNALQELRAGQMISGRDYQCCSIQTPDRQTL